MRISRLTCAGSGGSLQVNYRTSQEIRRRADRLHARSVTDVDGNEEVRAGTQSVFNGPDPIVQSSASREDETLAIAAWLREVTASGVLPNQIGVFARDDVMLARAEAAVRAAELPLTVIPPSGRAAGDGVRLASMHLAKGLEFRAVAVVACDDDVIPSAGRIGAATDPGELEEIHESERQLLYVACTRARERLLVTGVKPVSEFLRDLM